MRPAWASTDELDDTSYGNTPKDLPGFWPVAVFETVLRKHRNFLNIAFNRHNVRL
ncbi:hypothetical protein SAMN05443432_102300 [Roseovarius litoreus]|uniref:Uncharacterized protein n=1 Tax=Roseovarius litoreus TaxID=1155722 RepID=A0A1M7CTP0_9RHOB|nr:hypothetical protein SAMN05443432_102300 [Roseovarius litoreus]